MDCYFVLKTVPDLQCSPESYEDCEDILKQVSLLHLMSTNLLPKVPFFDSKEECVDVPYQNCVDVEEEVKLSCNQISVCPMCSRYQHRRASLSTPADRSMFCLPAMAGGVRVGVEEDGQATEVQAYLGKESRHRPT